MKAEFVRSYKSKKGNTTFVYRVSGNVDELEGFTEAQGEYLTLEDETGAPLWFTTRYIGEYGNLIITNKGNVIADMSEFEKIASLVGQFEGPLGEIMAKKMLDNVLTEKSVPTQRTLPTVEDNAADQTDDLDEV